MTLGGSISRGLFGLDGGPDVYGGRNGRGGRLGGIGVFTQGPGLLDGIVVDREGGVGTSGVGQKPVQPCFPAYVVEIGQEAGPFLVRIVMQAACV